jgi:Flp pilus assembly protein TadD
MMGKIMPHKKHHKTSNYKQQKLAAPSIEENMQIEQLLAHYPQIAQALHDSAELAEAEKALMPITDLSETTQYAYLKALAKENTVDAANILAAMHTLSPLKEVQKEARRSLIRLEATKIYPLWTPPQSPLAKPVVGEPAGSNPPRFWQGLMTDSRDVGEMQLLLFWEQGNNYKEVRMMGFLLEFWHDGIKDFFTETGSKRHMEKHIEYMRSQMAGIGLIKCTLARGRHLLEEALEVNKRYKTHPHSDYTRHLPAIHQMILEAPEAPEEGKALITLVPPQEPPKLPPISSIPQTFLNMLYPGLAQQKITNDFINAWSSGDYKIAYDLLTSDSPLRDGLAHEVWVAQRKQWYEAAQPTNLKVASIAAHDNNFAEDDLIDREDQNGDEYTVEVAWSLAFTAGPSLKELPRAITFYPETNRHWFWTTFTLKQEENNWHIYAMIDEGANAMQLPISELKKRQEEIANLATNHLERLRSKYDEDEDEPLDDTEDADEEEDEPLDDQFLETFHQLQGAAQIATRNLYYTDALIAQTQRVDPSLYQQAHKYCELIQDFEKAAVYLQLQADHLPDQRAQALRDLTLIQLAIGLQFNEEGEPEKYQHFSTLAEQTIRKAIDLENTPDGLITLAHILIEEGKQLEEAQKLLHQAQKLSPNTDEATLIEAKLGKIAQLREDPKLALKHYQRVAEIEPEYPGIWVNIAWIQDELEMHEEAIQNLRRSIEIAPDEIEAYIALGTIYHAVYDDFDSAEEILLEGLEVDEEDANLLGTLAMLYIEQGNIHEAERYLETAEDIEPASDFLKEVRNIFNIKKAEQHIKAKGEQRKTRKKSKRK